MDEIKLYPASYWECPKCHENYMEKHKPANLDNEDRIELADRLENWDGFNDEFYEIPQKVKCDKCGTEYKATPVDGWAEIDKEYHDEDDDDDEGEEWKNA